MARGAWMVSRRLAEAELVAVTADGAAVALMVDRPPRRPASSTRARRRSARP